MTAIDVKIYLRSLPLLRYRRQLERSALDRISSDFLWDCQMSTSQMTSIFTFGRFLTFSLGSNSIVGES
jgi:hypothetical protein